MQTFHLFYDVTDETYYISLEINGREIGIVDIDDNTADRLKDNKVQYVNTY
jgi:hypothetical protein